MIVNPVMCMKCNKTIATVKFTTMVEGKQHEIHLCQNCAASVSPYQQKMSSLENTWSEVLSQLLASSGSAKPSQESKADESKSPQEKIDAVCDCCGFPFENYRKSPFLGCSFCYTAFEKYLINDIRRIHGSIQHTGRIPMRFRKLVEIKRSLDYLKRELQEAIKCENFEQAAILRDKIRHLNDGKSSGD